MKYSDLAEALQAETHGLDHHTGLSATLSFSNNRKDIDGCIPGREINRIQHTHTATIGLGSESSLTMYQLDEIKSITLGGAVGAPTKQDRRNLATVA